MKISPQNKEDLTDRTDCTWDAHGRFYRQPMVGSRQPWPDLPYSFYFTYVSQSYCFYLLRFDNKSYTLPGSVGKNYWSLAQTMCSRTRYRDMNVHTCVVVG